MSLLLLAAASAPADTGLPAWAPTPDDVATLMFSRVKGEYDVLAEFTTDTRPTYNQVQGAIVDAVALVQTRIGFTLDERFNPSAKIHAKLMTALLLEPSFWSDEARPDKSAWEQWQKLYDDGIKGLIEAIRETGAGGDPGPADDAPMPVYSFPCAPTDCGY